LEVVDDELTMERLINQTPYAKPFTRCQRIAFFLTRGSNLIDMIAIAPFWVTLFIGDFLPNASFLRMIRMARIFRIFKTARYLDILQVLGLTLWKSIGMVFALFIVFALMGLIIGCLLYQIEHDETFETIPLSSYWIFVRLLNVKDVPYMDGMVSSVAGIVVLTVTMALKGVLWIIPMERIKQIYLNEYRSVTTMGDMRKDMDEFLTSKHKATPHLGSNTFARIQLIPCDWDVLKQGASIATLTLPLMKQEDVEADVDVAFQDCSGMLVLHIEWRPSADMLKAKAPALPDGLLRMSVVGAAGFPGHMRQRWRCVLQVPDQLFGLRIEETILSLCEPVAFDTPREFNIQWQPQGLALDEAVGTHPTHQPEAMDETSFRKRALSLLQEQSVQLAEQSEKLDTQSRQMEDYAVRLARMEARLQERLNLGS
jgi:hypothetical protein